MKKKILTMIFTMLAFTVILSGCAQKATVETRDVVQVADNDAVVSGYIAEYEEMPSSVGVYFGESENAMNKVISDTTPNGKSQSKDIDVEYDINVDASLILEPDTTYYYQFYARFDKDEVLGEVKSFKTLAEPKSAQISVISGEAKDITPTAATITGQLKDFSEKPTETGLYLGLSENEMKKVVREKNPYAQYDLKVLDVWFDTSADAKLSLLSDTTYYYQVYAKIGDGETRGEVKTFVTAPAEEQKAE